MGLSRGRRLARLIKVPAANVTGLVADQGIVSNDTIVANKAIVENYAATDNSIDLTAANVFTYTVSGNVTLSVDNVRPSGDVNSFVLELVNGGAYTVTWWSNLTWNGGTAPTLTTSGTDVLGFYTYDNGTTWRGLVVAQDIKAAA